MFPTGRRFVHEWAHLRWGVFDEYNDNEPYYSAKSKKIEATRHDYLNFLQLLWAVTSCFLSLISLKCQLFILSQCR